jgi:hypothetical protein
VGTILNKASMKPTRLLLLVLATSTSTAGGASEAQEPTVETQPAKASVANTPEETNLATTALGAEAKTVVGRSHGFDQLLAGQREAVAVLTEVVVVDWGFSVGISRVIMRIAQGSQGRLVMVALNEVGEKIDLSRPSGVKKLINDRGVDGNESLVMVDAGQIRARAIMFVWIAQRPDEPLVITELAILTKEKASPPQASKRSTLNPTLPVVPSPSVVEALRLSPVQQESQAESLAPLPETMPPFSRAISH